MNESDYALFHASCRYQMCYDTESMKPMNQAPCVRNDKNYSIYLIDYHTIIHDYHHMLHF